ncbi:hypothetical protein, partial [Roseisolibacter sp. H3M3-2]|uniref:hypothetical protein n=1 Tax=Roseisolibacter sp. H3M3-2 TaxID=3031323 RepID=UPI0023DA73E5
AATLAGAVRFSAALERRDAAEMRRLLAAGGTANVPRARMLQWLNGTRAVTAEVTWVGEPSRIDGRWSFPFRAIVRWLDEYGAQSSEQGAFRAVLARDGGWQLAAAAPAASFPAR